MNISKRSIGNISLVAVFFVFLIMLACSIFNFSIASQGYWKVIKAGIEAALVGGIADWFAVTALFHEVKLPFIRRHTNLLIRNREKIITGACSLVSEKWLSPSAIKKKLSHVEFIPYLLAFLHKMESQEKYETLFREWLKSLLAKVDVKRLSKRLHQILSSKIADTNLAQLLGEWLQDSIRQGKHNELWETLLSFLKKTANDSSTRKAISNILDRKIEGYKKTFFRSLFVTGAEFTDLINRQEIVDKIMDGIDNFVEEAKGNVSHPIRTKMNQLIQGFAYNLISGDEKTCKTVEQLKQSIIENTKLKSWIEDIFAYLTAKMNEELDSNDSSFMCYLKTTFLKALRDFESDKRKRKKTERWIKNAIYAFVENNHEQITDTVRMSLNELDNSAFSSQIEEKVGDDLQYIRLNGTLVGGTVGVIIGVINLFTEMSL